jgi:hypothetical protein
VPPDPRVEAVACQRCGHDYPAHGPVCSAPAPDDTWCGCRGFRWVDPRAAADLLGYHRPGLRP